MGRALFSQNYSTTSVDLDIHTSDTWSRSNPFDPDSDEFFLDAVYEAFLDPSEYQRQQEPRIALRDDEEENLDTRTSIVMQIDTDRDSGVSLGSGSPLLSSRGSPSPMAVGADDPAVILADAGYNDASLSAEWLRARASMAATYESWMRTGRSVSALPTEPTIPPAPGYIPPLSIEEEDRGRTAPISVEPQPIGRRLDRARSSSVSSAQDRLATTTPMISGRTVSITPIDVTPVERRPSPAPRSPSSMAILQTPPRSRDTPQTPDSNMVTPSPAPTVSPRIYNWQSYSPPWINQSPTLRPPIAQPAPSSPLPNPNARISHARITLAPVHLRMQSAAI